MLRIFSKVPTLDTFLIHLELPFIIKWVLTQMACPSIDVSEGLTLLKEAFTCQSVGHLDLFMLLQSFLMPYFVIFDIEETPQYVHLYKDLVGKSSIFFFRLDTLTELENSMLDTLIPGYEMRLLKRQLMPVFNLLSQFQIFYQHEFPQKSHLG
jgi:hypothetical protein